MMTVCALQALSNSTLEDKEAMENLTTISLILSHSLTQAQESILALSKNLNTLQSQMNTKKPKTGKPSTYKKKRYNKSKNYCWAHGRTRNHDHTSSTQNHPKEGHQVGETLETGWEEVESGARRVGPMTSMVVQETLIRRI